MNETAMPVAAIEAAVARVAAELPFPTVRYSDMGGNFATQLYFGSTVDVSTGLPVNRVGIDPDDEHATWWADFNMGTRTEISTLDANVDPAEIAAWITEVAQ